MKPKVFTIFIILIGLILNSCQKDKLETLSGTIWISNMTNNEVYKLEFLDESNLLQSFQSFRYSWLLDSYEPGSEVLIQTKYTYNHPNIYVEWGDKKMKLKGSAINFDGIACFKQ